MRGGIAEGTVRRERREQATPAPGTRGVRANDRLLYLHNDLIRPLHHSSLTGPQHSSEVVVTGNAARRIPRVSRQADVADSLPASAAHCDTASPAIWPHKKRNATNIYSLPG